MLATLLLPISTVVALAAITIVLVQQFQFCFSSKVATTSRSFFRTVDSQN